VDELRVDVITRHAIRNYGSVLQSIATRELLGRHGASARFVDYRQTGYDDTGWSVANRGSARRFPWPARVAYAALRHRGVRRIGHLFEMELRRELHLTSNSYRTIEQLKSSDEFATDSFYCAGSDQVWNVEYNVDNAPYYLAFAPKAARKFSLASSIGAASLPEIHERRLVEALSSFVGVSVREGEAAEYLRGLGIDAEQHVDPTLGVDPDFWRTFADESVPAEPYLLVYQLNGSAAFTPYVAELSRALDLPIKRIEYWRGPRSFGQHCEVLPTMQRYTQLFRDAAFVLTDSFHGTVFSTVFGKPFVAVAPPHYAGRIQSHLQLIGETHRLASNVNDAVNVAQGSHQLTSASQVLARERARINSYLDRVLHSEGRS